MSGDKGSRKIRRKVIIEAYYHEKRFGVQVALEKQTDKDVDWIRSVFDHCLSQILDQRSMTPGIYPELKKNISIRDGVLIYGANGLAAQEMEFFLDAIRQTIAVQGWDVEAVGKGELIPLLVGQEPRPKIRGYGDGSRAGAEVRLFKLDAKREFLPAMHAQLMQEAHIPEQSACEVSLSPATRWSEETLKIKMDSVKNKSEIRRLADAIRKQYPGISIAVYRSSIKISKGKSEEDIDTNLAERLLSVIRHCGITPRLKPDATSEPPTKRSRLWR